MWLQLAVDADAGDGGTPLWLGVLTLVLSAAALLVSLWQARESIAEMRRARPKVTVTGVYASNLASDGRTGPGFLIELQNLGREPTQVKSLWLASEDPGKDAPQMAINAGNARTEGPSIPFALDGHSSQVWVVHMDELSDRLKAFRATATFGHGARVSCVLGRDDMSPSADPPDGLKARLGNLLRTAARREPRAKRNLPF